MLKLTIKTRMRGTSSGPQYIILFNEFDEVDDENAKPLRTSAFLKDYLGTSMRYGSGTSRSSGQHQKDRDVTGTPPMKTT